MEDDLKKMREKKWKMTSKKIKNGRRPQKNKLEEENDLKKIILKREDDQKKEKKEDDLKNKNLFLIPLKFRGKPFLGLAQLSKIFHRLKSLNFS